MRSTLRGRTIVKMTGKLLWVEGVLLLLPMTVSLIYSERDWWTFLLASVVAAVGGTLCVKLPNQPSNSLRPREGFILTAVIWWVFGFVGIIPLMLCGNGLGFTDAMFEIISGLTTTGASVIKDVDAMGHGIIFWRALSQWIGGLGIILFILALLPELNRNSGLSLFNAEATGITHDKARPRIRQTALMLWCVYLALTVIFTVLLWVGPMNLFDALCQTMTAIATGGFTSRSAGIMYWNSDYVLAVLTLCMFLGGTSFMLIYNVSLGHWKEMLRNTVFKAYLILIGCGVALTVLSMEIGGAELTPVKWLAYPLFYVMSAITTTGFSIEGCEHWGWGAYTVTILLMLSGACAGSTTGGIKIDRLAAVWKNMVNELRATSFPKRTFVVRLNGHTLNQGQLSRLTAFVGLYLTVLCLTVLISCMWGYNPSDALFMCTSCIGCNGLGYGITGEAGGYGLLPDGLKWIMILVMMLGRLEIFTFLALLLPSFWRK